MKTIPITSRVYLGLVFVAGLAAVGWACSRLGDPLDTSQLILLEACGVVAALAYVRKVEGATPKSSYDLALAVYGFVLVLLGPEAAVVVALVGLGADWLFHKTLWYIQLFNVCSMVLAATAAGLVYGRSGEVISQIGLTGAVRMVGAIATFVLVNHVMVALAIRLNTGESIAESGVLGGLTLAIDGALVAAGAAAAAVWQVNPFVLVIALTPVYLISATLKIPALERQATSDAKTGLHNARYFQDALEREMARAERYGHPLTVVMGDLDLLRNINNVYGHLAGDVVLAGVAQILKRSVREFDVVARFGGEEFTMLLTETTVEDAAARVEAIRAAIEAAEFDVPTSPEPIRATMSFGIAGRSFEHAGPQELLHDADVAVYRAKTEGRNRARIAETPGEQRWQGVPAGVEVSGESAGEGAVRAVPALLAAPPSSPPAIPAQVGRPARPAGEAAGGAGPSRGGGFKQTWVRQLRWRVPYYIGLSTLVFALVIGYEYTGAVGAICVLAPVLVLLFGQKQYVSHTREAVTRLRKINSEVRRRAEVKDSLSEGLLALLSKAVDLRDPYGLGHSRHVARYGALIANGLGLGAERVEQVRAAGLLHDIGKLALPDEILMKTGRLSDGEFEEMKQHPRAGADVLGESESLRHLGRMVLHHHERYDGAGYPDGLRGEEIPLESRILAVADAVEAMASDRAYREGSEPAKVLDEIKKNAGTQFDPLVVETLCRVVDSSDGTIINSTYEVNANRAASATLRRPRAIDAVRGSAPPISASR